MSERKGETKRQHYVPRMILRNFSKNGKRLSLFIDGKRIDRASLRDQCQEDYFYGADQVMEKSFAEEEGKMATFFGDLAPERFAILRDEDVHRLKLFVAYQHARTRGAAEHLSKFTGAFAKQTLRDSLVLNKSTEISPEDLESVEIGIKGAQHEAIWLAAKTHPILLDMNVKFITTARTPGFVIADHPVVAYNQFAEHHPILSRYPTSTGMALKGLQLFLPLSPSMVLAVFDPSTYEYGGKSSVCKAGPADVAHLNRMQAVNAYSCFYFDDRRMTDAALSDLEQARAKHPSVYEKHVATSPMIRREDGKMSRFIVVHHAEVRVGAKLSFIRAIDGHSYEDYKGPSVPIRSREVMDFAELYGKKLEEEVAKRRAARPEEGTSDTVITAEGASAPDALRT
ncbi:DUF4238 domain-containing protein [Sorangium sp. So ce204]|uniref:DUF4238 domain-containing protein n=1 Tax=Sorangium sp. So ce204 TaxID=3133288 RepID=UPI003F64692A